MEQKDDDRKAVPSEGNVRLHPALPPGVTMERRKSIHRQSILYPLASDFLPVGTILQETQNGRNVSFSCSVFPVEPARKLSSSIPRKLSSSHSVYTTDLVQDIRVHPNDSFRESSRVGTIATIGGGALGMSTTTAGEAAEKVNLQSFPLRFRDTGQEEAFCRHFNMYVTNKVRLCSRVVIFLNTVMLVAQSATQRSLASNAVFISRAVIVGFSLLFQVGTFTNWFSRRFDRCMLAHYIILDVVHQLPRFTFLMGSFEAEIAASQSTIDELSLFASQKSVRAMHLLFILIIFIASGMRFTVASVCGCCHVVAKAFFAVVFCRECTWDDLDCTTNLAMVAFCTLTAYHSERYVRLEYVARLNVDEERKRRDDLLETMLPVHIKERLKDNRTDGLADTYDEVSILFCYVSNFQTLSKHASAIELVQLMNRIVFCFDSATDVHGVYKVEAIAETYLCAAGVPQRDPFHCEKVADMALTMMRICETESWSFNGVDIQLQIGIHSGPVVAGVVGSKTYSYHLFGDTVNTSSRVCSSGVAGRIQLSDRSRQLLERTGNYIISERGTMNLKGKGMVELFWLEGKHSGSCGSDRINRLDVFSNFEASVEESIRAKDLEFKSPLHHHSDEYLGCMNSVEIRRLTLDFRRKQPRRLSSNWLKAPFKSSRIRVAPNHKTRPTISALERAGIDTSSSRNVQDVNDTANDMETSFRSDHNRDNMDQFCMALYMCAAYVLVTLIYKAYSNRVYPNKAAIDAIGYSLYSTAIFVLLLIVQLLKKYPSLAKRKESWATRTGYTFVTAMNLQLLVLIDTTTVNDSQPRGEQRITFLDANLLFAVMLGLVMRIRFRNAALVSIWGFIVFVVCASYRHAEEWSDLAESFCLLLTADLLSIYFAYKRELGLRRDFLLKITLHLEKQKCEDLLTNMLPSKQYAEALMQQSTIVDELAEVTLLYSDMVGFTPLGAKLEPAAICIMLNQIYSAFDRHLDELGIYKMDTVGDAFIVVGGLPGHKSSKNHAAAIAAFAVEMLREIERFCAESNVTLQMRIGIHTGNVVGGVVGIKKPRYLIWGRHTVIANLMESRGVAGRIQLSETTYEHIRDCPEFHVEDRTHHVQIGEKDTIQTYFLAPDHPTVKDSVISRCLEETPIFHNLEDTVLDQLRTCLLPDTNSPRSKHLETSISRRYSDQQKTTHTADRLVSSSKLIQSKSFPRLLQD